MQFYIQHKKQCFSTLLPVTYRLFIKNGLHGWRASCNWTVNFKRLQDEELYSIKELTIITSNGYNIIISCIRCCCVLLLISFIIFLNIFKISKVLFWIISKINRLSLKPSKAFRTAQWKQPQLNFDLNYQV